jgi:hypothetical protein
MINRWLHIIPFDLWELLSNDQWSIVGYTLYHSIFENFSRMIGDQSWLHIIPFDLWELLSNDRRSIVGYTLYHSTLENFSRMIGDQSLVTHYTIIPLWTPLELSRSTIDFYTKLGCMIKIKDWEYLHRQYICCNTLHRNIRPVTLHLHIRLRHSIGCRFLSYIQSFAGHVIRSLWPIFELGMIKLSLLIVN